MSLPTLFHSFLSVLLYLLLLYIVSMGIWQFLTIRKMTEDSERKKIRSLVPIGAIAAIFGVIGYIKNYKQALSDIEAADDISPSIVAGAMNVGFSYPILGLLTLAISFAFLYINRQ